MKGSNMGKQMLQEPAGACVTRGGLDQGEGHPLRVGETPPPPHSVGQISPIPPFGLSCPVLSCCLFVLCCPGLSCPSKVILGMLGKAFWYYKNNTFLALSYFKIRWHNDGKIIKNCIQGRPKMDLKPFPRGPKRVIAIDPVRSRALGGPQEPPQNLPKRSQEAPMSPQDVPQEAPRRPKKLRDVPQEAPRQPMRVHDAPQEVPKTAQDGSETPQDAPRDAPNGPRGSETSPKRRQEDPPKTDPRPIKSHPKTFQI